MTRTLLVACAATLCASAAIAQPTGKPEDQWQVSPNEGGCAILRTVSGEGSAAIMVSLNYNDASQVVFFAPGSKIEPGMFYTGMIMWDDKLFPAHFLSGGSPEVPGVALEANDARLVDAIARNEQVSVALPAVTPAMEFPLPGAKEAIANLRKCVAETKPK